MSTPHLPAQPSDDSASPSACRWSVVIPAFNEEQRLAPTVRGMVRYLDGRGERYEILVVDDGSADGTARVARELAAAAVRVISYQPNRGKGFAVRTGVLAARGDYVLVADADGSVAIEELESFRPWLEQGCDAVIASRYLGDSRVTLRQPLYRVAWSRLGGRFIRGLLVPGIRDVYCGFKCFRRDCARKLFQAQRMNGLAYDIEILALARHFGCRVREVPVAWRDDRRSRLSPWKEALRGARDLVRIKGRQLRGWK